MKNACALEKPPLGEKNRRRRMRRGKRSLSHYRVREKSAWWWQTASGRHVVENNPLNKTDPTGQMSVLGSGMDCDMTYCHIPTPQPPDSGSHHTPGPPATGSHIPGTMSHVGNVTCTSMDCGSMVVSYQSTKAANSHNNPNTHNITQQRPASPGGNYPGLSPQQAADFKQQEQGIDAMAPSLYVLPFGKAIEGLSILGRALASFFGRELGQVATDSAAGLISKTAQSEVSKGVEHLKGLMTRPERDAFEANPIRGSRFLGQAAHRATFRALDKVFPKRFQYNLRGPDFLDKWTGEQIELTTPGQIMRHLARPGYEDISIAPYRLPPPPYR